jgi:hypothetical protein
MNQADSLSEKEYEQSANHAKKFDIFVSFYQLECSPGLSAKFQVALPPVLSLGWLNRQHVKYFPLS